MSRLEIFLDKIFLEYRWLAHFVYWILVLSLYVVFFGRQNNNYFQTLFFAGLLLPITIATTYFLNYFLVPRYLLRDRYFFFALYFIYTMIAAIFLELVIVLITFLFLAEVNIRNMSPASVDTFFLMTSTLMVAFFGMGVKLLLHYKKSKANNDTLQKEKMETELKFLKAQLNPHFLFNTLNNLYFLTQEKSDRAPAAVLQLSEILDYVLNTSKLNFVPLNKELHQVQNYIALESLRYEDRVTINTLVEGKTENAVIAPMMLFTLVENAFKHGVMKLTGKSWIDISVIVDSSGINISIRNNMKSRVNGHGIGLRNLHAQLELIYRDKFMLSINDKRDDEFGVNLILPI